MQKCRLIVIARVEALDLWWEVRSRLRSKRFVPVRKRQTPQAKPFAKSYALECGTDLIEMHDDSLKAGDKVLLVDDLVATGEVLREPLRSLKTWRKNYWGVCCIVDLPELGGGKKLRSKGYSFFHIHGI